MRIAFLINAVADEWPVYTTTWLAREAVQRGHDVVYVDVGDLTLAPDGGLHALARRAAGAAADRAAFLAAVAAAEPAPLDVRELDVLMVRTVPELDALGAPWRQPLGHLFGELARRSGVTVLSDPRGLALAGPDKLYTLRFPERLRPATLITRDLDAVRAFAADHAGQVILKPLNGCCGHRVFLLGEGDPNLAPCFEAVAAEGYVIAQEYVRANAGGSIRLFMLGGEPLTVDGRVAVMRMPPAEGDIRTNYGITWTVAPPEPGDDTAEIAAAAGPVLAADGMFLAALDITGGKILEVGLWSPGGLRGAQRVNGVDFVGAVVDAMTAARTTAHPPAAAPGPATPAPASASASAAPAPAVSAAEGPA